MTEALQFENPAIDPAPLDAIELDSICNLQSEVIDLLGRHSNIETALCQLCLRVEALIPGAGISIMQYTQGEQALNVRLAPFLSPAAINDLN